MTLGQMYTTITQLVYGDTIPPDHEPARIQEEILYLHHQVQQDYNYWYMYVLTTAHVNAGIDFYILPDNYKALISLDISRPAQIISANQNILPAVYS